MKAIDPLDVPPNSANSFHCPACGKWHRLMHACDNWPKPTSVYGCICPPGANLTCKAPLCPRQGARA